MQDYADDLTSQSLADRLRISFGKFEPSFDPIVVNDKAIEVVTSLKVLGLDISD